VTALAALCRARSGIVDGAPERVHLQAALGPFGIRTPGKALSRA